MRGNESKQQPVFSYVSLEERIPKDNPLRPIRNLVDQILAGMSKHFDTLYAEAGRPWIPPERLLRLEQSGKACFERPQGSDTRNEVGLVSSAPAIL